MRQCMTMYELLLSQLDGNRSPGWLILPMRHWVDQNDQSRPTHVLARISALHLLVDSRGDGRESTLQSKGQGLFSAFLTHCLNLFPSLLCSHFRDDDPGLPEGTPLTPGPTSGKRSPERVLALQSSETIPKRRIRCVCNQSKCLETRANLSGGTVSLSSTSKTQRSPRSKSSIPLKPVPPPPTIRLWFWSSSRVWGA